MLPEIRGLSRELQAALVNILAIVLASPDVDHDVERRTQWLKSKLEGSDPIEAAQRAQRAA